MARHKGAARPGAPVRHVLPKGCLLIMPAKPPNVTPAPLIDLLPGGAIAIQFPGSGAYLRINPTGTVEPLITDATPTFEEVTIAAHVLRQGDSVVQAAVLTQWRAAA